jgi:hypothetical protein
MLDSIFDSRESDPGVGAMESYGYVWKMFVYKPTPWLPQQRLAEAAKVQLIKNHERRPDWGRFSLNHPASLLE